MDRDELIARLRRNSGWRNERHECVTDPALLMEAADALESRPAPTEERAREILTEEALATGEFASINTTADGGWNPWPIAVRAMLRFATETQPVAGGGQPCEVDDETRAEIENVEKAKVVVWLRHQSDLGADIGIAADKGSTRRVAFGGGSLALKRAADAIEADEHLGDTPKPTTPERVNALEEALQAVRACRLPPMQGVGIHGVYETGPSWSVSGLTALLPMIEAALSASPPDVVER